MVSSKDNALICIQLTNDDKLSDEQYNSIAELIYDTDPYIYPAMFGSGEIGKRNAIAILSDLYKTGMDNMFCLDNLFVSIMEDKIVGLILWHEGELEWTCDELLRIAYINNIDINYDNIRLVKDNYFSAKYKEDDPANVSISLVNVSVSCSCRGNGIGSIMLKRFIELHKSEQLKLCVISNNESAVKMYSNQGFVIRDEYVGFSFNDEKPRCFNMTKNC